ncbi:MULTISPECIES: dynamin family protein [unclassified Campylobacter]|uniref:dynamin family protein n=1 Tax=unclassified Campylobacter TaxID=2593542 RepID=UPI001237B246|nr:MULTISPECIES: dynamin family protein [unclassified Campylobacter]KAA6227332.1 ATP-binding protein [Campylobacter sp. LR286c]KAA6227793.1 ATP-binding protein [Campylobacter sp. LR185c]KAA6228201.1 ATP-binding protein [Campylobacter sp. LR196d]KAA6229201.1 ATP-binding protein [Campylobacter sp. LR291e]KAA8604519.1 ATP-binding protein [Campylobacter sp. LR185c]
MNLQEFLQQTWQNRLQFLDINANFKCDLDISECAIILSANLQNYERYFLLQEFKNIFQKIGCRVDIFELQNTQLCLIKLIKEGFLDKNDLLKALKILENVSNNILISEFLQKLEVNKIDKKAEFKASFKELDSINLKLQELSLSENTKQRLQSTLHKFKNLEFNIAITGVMNAGKSSLLNALLKEDFLGVSNIPETANLTILKYGDSNIAKIYFWNENEWENIIKSAKFSDELNDFVLKLEKEVNIKDYVFKENKIQEIPINTLKDFSSAKNKLSALIKKIELYTNLEFLQNNISVVDTPGLDDIVVQREIVTNEYLKESDFLIHLMNASQSLTQKDSEFLINCLLNSRLNKFLIVLTKADLLSQNELDEVIEYTKNSLQNRLEAVDINLVEKIDFLCVSAKKASDFYQKKANENSLKESKMLEFEEYLFNALYGGQKSKIALNAYKKELLLELNALIEEYELANKLLKDKSANLSLENENLLKEFKEQKKALESAKNEIKFSKDKLENIQSGIENLLLLLAKKLKERLVDELSYIKNNAKKLNLARILNIIDICVKDGINDILREVKFENLKKIDDIKTKLSIEYKFLQDDFDNGFEAFKDGISKNIDNIFSGEKFALLRMQISKLCEQKMELFMLEKELDTMILQGFKDFELNKMLDSLNINSTFFNFLNEKLQHFEKMQNEKLQNLQALLSNLNNENVNFTSTYEENNEKIALLNQLKIGLLNAN